MKTEYYSAIIFLLACYCIKKLKQQQLSKCTKTEDMHEHV